jgi:hypothetical protein
MVGLQVSFGKMPAAVHRSGETSTGSRDWYILSANWGDISGVNARGEGMKTYRNFVRIALLSVAFGVLAWSQAVSTS